MGGNPPIGGKKILPISDCYGNAQIYVFIPKIKTFKPELLHFIT